MFGVPAVELVSVVATDTQETLLRGAARLAPLSASQRPVGVGPFVSCGM